MDDKKRRGATMEHRSQLPVGGLQIGRHSFLQENSPDPGTVRGRAPIHRPALLLEGQLVKEVTSYKYLGVQIDSQLRWKEQAQQATANAPKWILQFRRLTRPSTGVRSRLMRQLYLAVALPKITYGLDIWYTPPTK